MSKDNNCKVKLQLNSQNGAITFALFMVGYIVLSLLGQLIVGAIFGNTSTAFKAICATFSTACVLAVVLVYALWGNNRFTQVCSIKSFKWWQGFLAILLSVGMFLGLGFVNESIASLFSAWGLNVKVLKLDMPTFWHFFSYLITFAILPAIFEEILFRGILLNCFSGMRRIVSVLISALLFALYHQSFVQFFYQFIYGVALGFLATNAKSVIPCIIAHFINNFTVLLLSYLQISLNLFSPIVLVIGANALAVFGTIIFFLERKIGKRESVKGEVKAFFLPFGTFGILVCLAVAVGNLVV